VGRTFEFAPLDEVAETVIRGRAPGRRPLAAVTFDDGYGDVYQYAFPMLQSMGIPAAVFVVTDRVGTSGLFTHDELYLLLQAAFATGESFQSIISRSGVELAKCSAAAPSDARLAMTLLLEQLPQAEVRRIISVLSREFEVDAATRRELRALDWSELRTMQKEGATIGSHTTSHILTTNEAPDTVARETRDSKVILEKRLGEPVRHFAYPDGRFNGGAVRAVKSAGYDYAYTTCQHRDAESPELTIPRSVLWERSATDALGGFSPAVMTCHMNGVFDLSRSCGLKHGAGVKQAAGAAETVKVSLT
jgi:peptidoglycan/xylan/chitin deacetylase (PgdA/CDA1 family)